MCKPIGEYTGLFFCPTYGNIRQIHEGKGKEMKKMKKSWIVLLLCVLGFGAARQPLCRLRAEETVSVRFETDNTLQTENFTLPPERNTELQEILGRKAWFFGTGFSDFFLGQNDVDLAEDDLLTLYYEKDSLSISSNGVIRSIHRDKYAYLRLAGTQKDGQEVYDALYTLVEPYLEKR